MNRRNSALWLAGLTVFCLGLIRPCPGQTTDVESTNTLPKTAGPFYSLEQFGPVNSPEEASKTYQKATDALIAAGGGVIVIPENAPAAWHPTNNSQKTIRIPAAPEPARSWRKGRGVTVIDARTGTIQIQPPQETGIEFNRTLKLGLNESLPFWDYFPVVSINNNILRGSTSYRELTGEDVPVGKDQRYYVSTIRGVFPGMFMSGRDRLFVKALGYDKEKKSWYFTADNVSGDGANNLIGNKNHVNCLHMETFSHTENQTFDVMMWRHNYSQGDNYLIDARFKYMSDVHSTGGDENGVIYGAFVEAETAIFRGKVDSWDAATAALKYKDAPTEGKTLGSGRPIINMNPAKWINQGEVRIVRPGSWTEPDDVVTNPVYQGKSYPTTISPNKAWAHSLTVGGLIRLSADAPVTDDAVGRYFAVNDPSEMALNTLYRWYLIDSVTQNPDGTKDIRIIRHWWGAKFAGSPTLYKENNYTSDGHDHPMKYIIAPGANAYDVADGVNNGQHLIRLVPTPFTGSTVDFAKDDPIEQAIGPDPFKPIPFRSWVWDAVPGIFPSPIFDLANNGQVQRDAALKIHGGGGNIDVDLARRFDQKPAWDKFLSFETTCNNGIRFGADTANSAILFVQPHDRAQAIKWYYRPETNLPPREASMTVSPATGDLRFNGNAKFDGSVGAKGISGGEKPAHNLRGLNLAVPSGSRELSVKFEQSEADNAYMAVLQLSWLTNHAVVNRTADGFTVKFATPPTENSELSWLLVR